MSNDDVIKVITFENINSPYTLTIITKEKTKILIDDPCIDCEYPELISYDKNDKIQKTNITNDIYFKLSTH